MSYGFGKLNEYAERCHQIAKDRGWHDANCPSWDEIGFAALSDRDARHILSWLMLVTTEVAEAAEALRKNDKANFAEELADICIRVFDTAEALGINLEQEIVNKMAKNEQRSHMHGGKLA